MVTGLRYLVRGWLTALAGLFLAWGEALAKPNIIFIMADDMGYGDLGCYGGRHIETPHLDRMAKEGLRFTQCYSGSPVCAPARSVLMTGLHAGHTRVRGNTGRGGVVGLGGKEGRVPLRDEDVTVAEVLKKAGYVAGMAGKWGLGEPGTTGLPVRQGFDEWFGHLNQRRAHTYYPDYLWLNDARFELPGNTGGRRQQYSHDLFTGFALNFIRRHREEPFFLYLPYTVPHARFEIPDLGAYAEKEWTEQEKVYAAMITRLDADVGALLALLRELDLDENTVVFFCSDNGAANRYDSLFRSSGALRGRKRDMTEGGIRTPMIVRWPGTISPDRVSDAPWTFTDFLATAADIGGLPVPPETDGMSVLPTLKGKHQPELENRFLYWEFFEGGFKQAARWQAWKAIRSRPDKAIELYHLENDPGEAQDVARQHPEVVLAFENYLAGARWPSEAWPSPIDDQLGYALERTTILTSVEPDWLWFQSRPVAIPGDGDGGPRVLVTTQKTKRFEPHGYFDWHHVQSVDGGGQWSEPVGIPGLRRQREANGDERVPGDLWLSWHEPSKTVLATGKTFTFEDQGRRENNRLEEVSYAVYRPAEGVWSGMRILELPERDHDGKPFIAPNAGCNQAVVLADGDVLLPIRYQKVMDPVNYTTMVARCRYDGEELVYEEHGSELSLPQGRGLYEPSLAKVGSSYFLTLRADDTAYVARSADGLHFDPIQEWAFDDGAPLGSYNTQQHWVTRGNTLFLVYTRRGAENDHVFRHRAPLFMARVDLEALCVLRHTERVLIPEDGARLGNFGVCNVGADETWVVTSEFFDRDSARAQAANRVLLAKIRWLGREDPR